MKKRILSILLAVVMIVGMLPVTAMAEDADLTRTLSTGKLTVTDPTPSPDDWFNVNNGVIELYRGPEDVDVVIPETIGGVAVTGIYNGVFISKGIKSVSGPSIVSLGERTFSDCAKLESVSFPKVTSAGKTSFQNCGSLVSVDMPKLTGIASNAFTGCSSLESVSFPDAATIGDHAFDGCVKLASVSAPKATSIGECAFSSCGKLTETYLYLPQATDFGDSAFEWCNSLTSFVFPEGAKIGSRLFANCAISRVEFLGVPVLIAERAFADVGSFDNPAQLILPEGWGEDVPDEYGDWHWGTFAVTKPDEPDGPEHTHSFAEAWTISGNTHYHACTAEGCDIIDYATCNIPEAAFRYHMFTIDSGYTTDEINHPGQHANACICGIDGGNWVDHDFSNGDCVCGAKKPAPAHTHGTGESAVTFTKAIETFADLQDLFAEDGSGYLANDITLTEDSSLVVAEGKTVDLCLNDKVLNLNKKGNIAVATGATLNLYDCGEGTTRYYDKDATTGLWTLDTALTSGNCSTTGGIITGGATGGGGCVYVAGLFTMNGGSITGNFAENIGGGVYIEDGSFTLNGGSITGNFAENIGGGVYIEDGSFTMNGGSIVGNTTNASFGGGVYVDNDNGFTMTGGSITDNMAPYGGGVFVDNCSFNMTGGSITGNNAEIGGGVFVEDNSFNMTGGSITGNNAEIGGGVFLYGTMTLGCTAKIAGNLKSDDKSVSNLYLRDGSTVTLGTGADAPAPGMLIGVTMESGIGVFTTTSSNAEAAKDCFFSDNTDYAVKFNTDHLELVAKKYNVTAQVQGSHGSAKAEVDSAEVTEAIKDASVVFTATPDSGYEFDHWEVVSGGIALSETDTDDLYKGNNPITVTMPDTELTLKAHFKEIVPTAFNVIVEDDGHGTAKAQVGGADVAEPVTKDTEVTLIPAANEGYAFKEWQVIRGGVTITDNKFTMPANEVKIKAIFEKVYTVTVEANGHGSASANVTSGISGTEVILTINPETGYEVDVINVIRGGVTVVDNKFTIGTADVKIKVTFKEIAPDAYGIIVEDDGHGTAKAQVSSSDVTSAAPNAEVTLIANPNEGYAFKEWQVIRGGVTITDNKFTMPANEVKIKAIFEKVYTVTVEANGHGSASADVTEGVSGTEVTLTVNADSGYEVDAINVIRGGVEVSNNKFTIGTADVKIQVTFKETTPDAYNIIVEDDGHGTAKAQVGGEDKTSAAPNAEVTLIATPSAGYVFKEWVDVRGNAGEFDKTTATTTLTMPANEVKVKAIFERVYNINLQSDGHADPLAWLNDTDSVTTAKAGDSITLHYENLDEGYEFEAFEVVSGTIVFDEIGNTFTMPAENVTIRMTFKEIETPEPEGECVYTECVKLTENGTYGLKLNCKDMGEFEFKQVEGGWSIKNADGKYLAMKDGKLALSDTAFAWTYKNGAFYTTVKTEQKSGGYWFGWIYIPGRGSNTVTTTYYLSTVTEGAKLSTCCVSTELYKEVSGEHDFGCWIDCKDGTHKHVCKYCGKTEIEAHKYDQITHKCVECGAYDPDFANVKISVVKTEKTTKQSSGWWSQKCKEVTTYTYTIKTEATGTKVSKTEYSVDRGKTWCKGTAYSSTVPLASMLVRVTDSNGRVYDYEYKESEPPVCEHEYGCAVYVDKDAHKYVCKHCGDVKTEAHSYDGTTHKCVCGAFDPAHSGVKISVDVKEKTSKQYVGWWSWGSYKNVTTYTATIKTEATGVRVTKVQYQLNGGRWTTGTCVSSDKPINSLKVKVTDNKGNVYEYTYPGN